MEVDKSDIVGLMWMKVPRAYQLGVRIKAGLVYKFTGFREQVMSWISFILLGISSLINYSYFLSDMLL